MIKIDDIKKDIISFADDVNEVIFERDGNVIFTRHGEDIHFKLLRESNKLLVLYNDTKLPYNSFLTKEVAKLDLFANRLIEKRDNIDVYVDPEAKLITTAKKSEDKGLALLKQECDNTLFFGTKVTFVTADAGCGKTVLLKEFQIEQAKRFLEGKSSYLFWHIDLQGRDLVRLNEAIMYDLGDLRITGLYESSILTLIKHHNIVLGIDGFDELAAEIGGENALGSLSSLVLKMEGNGNLVAASRRAFFNTQDFLKRTELLYRTVSQDCDFNELKIKNWTRKENIEYLGYHFSNPDDKYKEITKELKSEKHPLLERPYLFAKVVSILSQDNLKASDFLKGTKTNLDSINDVIEPFIEREVIKWKERDKITGKPYLSFNQHLEFLAHIANEMWENQSDIMSIDTIQFILTILIDDWQINERIKPIVINMVESHALLIPVSGKENYRKFDHFEFKHFFLAKALQLIVKNALENSKDHILKKFLYISQLPDSVARYYSEKVNDNDIIKTVELLKKIISDEWKPSYLQPNIGTLIPYLLNGANNTSTIVINQKLTFTSLIFERKNLINLHFINGLFINTSLRKTIFQNVLFENCSFNEIAIYYESNNQFENVVFKNCDINSVAMVNNDGEKFTEFSPTNVINTLKNNDLSIEEELIKSPKVQRKYKNELFIKCVKKFLNKFNTAAYQYEVDIKGESHYGDPRIILYEIIPLLIKYNIIEEKVTKKTRQAGSRAWRIKHNDISSIFKAEEDQASAFYKFWEELYDHE